MTSHKVAPDKTSLIQAVRYTIVDEKSIWKQ